MDEVTLNHVYEAFKTLTDKKKNVYDEDIEALIESELESSGASDLWKLTKFTYSAGAGVAPSATIALVDATGTAREGTFTGDGPVDAIYTGLQELTGVDATLLDYALRAVSRGRDAQGEVRVEIDHNGRRVRGRSVSTDVIEASAKAYLSAINRIRTLERRAEHDGETKAQQP